MSELFGTSQTHLQQLDANLLIHKAVVSAWFELKSAAAKDGIELEIASAFRGYDRQLNIWNRKFCGELAVKNDQNQLVDCSVLSEFEKISAIMRYSALPGASRHHWGTDFDIYSSQLLAGKTLQLELWEYEQNGPMWPLTQWLDQNMHNFGFFRPYDIDRGGIAPEPWHISYAKIANEYQQQLTAGLLAKFVTSSKVSGKACLLDNWSYIYPRFIEKVGSFNA